MDNIINVKKIGYEVYLQTYPPIAQFLDKPHNIRPQSQLRPKKYFDN